MNKFTINRCFGSIQISQTINVDKVRGKDGNMHHLRSCYSQLFEPKIKNQGENIQPRIINIRQQKKKVWENFSNQYSDAEILFHSSFFDTLHFFTI